MTGVVGIDRRKVHSAAAGVPVATAKSPAGPAGVVLTAPALAAAPAPQKTEYTEPVTEAEVPWVTIVWNDPVNLMSYVTLVFQKLLGHPRPRAEALMLDVHHKGRATVSNGPREQMEADVAKLQGAGLWATMAKDS